MDFDEVKKKINDAKKEIEDLSDDAVSERLEKYLFEKAAKSASVRMSIRTTLEFANEIKDKTGEDTSQNAIRSCAKAMVVNAATELGGGLSDKDMKKLEGIAMKTIAEEIGEE